MGFAQPLRAFSFSVGAATLLTAFAGLPAASAGAPVPPKIANAPTAKAPGPVRSAMDPVLLGELVTFLRDYDRALETGDRAYLKAHTVWPLPFASVEYNMEAKTRGGRLASVEALLAGSPPPRDLLRLPKELVPASPQALPELKQGVQQCEKKDAAATPDFTQGAPALNFRPDGSVTLAYLSEPCAAETHIVTWTIKKAAGSWRLAGRATRMGTK